MTLGKRFRSKGSEALRKVPGTQAQKARRLGVDQAAISLWENGERSPRRENRRAMVRAWGIEFSWWDEEYVAQSNTPAGLAA